MCTTGSPVYVVRQQKNSIAAATTMTRKPVYVTEMHLYKKGEPIVGVETAASPRAMTIDDR